MRFGSGLAGVLWSVHLGFCESLEERYLNPIEFSEVSSRSSAEYICLAKKKNTVYIYINLF